MWAGGGWGADGEELGGLEEDGLEGGLGGGLEGAWGEDGEALGGVEQRDFGLEMDDEAPEWA